MSKCSSDGISHKRDEAFQVQSIRDTITVKRMIYTFELIQFGREKKYTSYHMTLLFSKKKDPNFGEKKAKKNCEIKNRKMELIESD